MLLIMIALLPIIIYLLVRYPYVLAVLTLFLPTESPGVGAAVSRSLKILVPLMYAGYFLAVFKMLYILWIRRNVSIVSRRIVKIALLAAGISGWIAFSMFACDTSRREIIIMSLGAVPGALFVLVYYNHRPARILLVAALAVHLVIGCAVMAFPHSPLAVLRQPTSIGAALPDLWSMETTVHKDSAQFESAVHLAFYAAAGLLIGMSLLLYNPRTLVRVFGAFLAGLGLAATFFTFERGIWIGILVGILVLVAPLKRKPIGKMIYAAIFSALALGVFAVCTSADNLILVTLREHFLAIREDSYRIPVAIRSTDILVTRPLFGVGGEILDLIELVGGAPHQSFYFYAVTYGIPAGVFVAILTWWSLAVNFSRRKPIYASGLTQYDQLLAKSLGWVVFAMAMTNGMSGGMLGWIFLGFACLPWAYNNVQRSTLNIQRSKLRVGGCPAFGRDPARAGEAGS